MVTHATPGARTVCTPEMALTTVDLPCATCPIVPGGGQSVGESGRKGRRRRSAEPPSHYVLCSISAAASLTDVDSRLPANDLRAQRRQLGHI